MLTWSETTDTDPYNTSHYDVRLDTLAGLPAAWSVGDSLADTTVTVSGLLDDHTYFWTVRATDSNTPGTWASDTLSFATYLPEPPSAFDLAAPDSGAEFPDEREFPVVFRWAPAEDPDPGDVLHYTLLLSTGPDFSDPAAFDAGTADSFAVDSLERNLYWWKVEAADRFGLLAMSAQTWTIDVTLAVPGSSPFAGVPEEFTIAGAYPNPFNPALTLVVGLPEAADLRVRVYNLLGRQVAELVNGRTEKGYRRFIFDAPGLSSGIYFIHAEVPGRMNEVRKVVLMR